MAGRQGILGALARLAAKVEEARPALDLTGMSSVGRELAVPTSGALVPAKAPGALQAVEKVLEAPVSRRDVLRRAAGTAARQALPDLTGLASTLPNVARAAKVAEKAAQPDLSALYAALLRETLYEDAGHVFAHDWGSGQVRQIGKLVRGDRFTTAPTADGMFGNIPMENLSVHLPSGEVLQGWRRLLDGPGESGVISLREPQP
jgi:hypothetical protein